MWGLGLGLGVGCRVGGGGGGGGGGGSFIHLLGLGFRVYCLLLHRLTLSLGVGFRCGV